MSTENNKYDNKNQIETICFSTHTYNWTVKKARFEKSNLFLIGSLKNDIVIDLWFLNSIEDELDIIVTNNNIIKSKIIFLDGTEVVFKKPFLLEYNYNHLKMIAVLESKLINSIIDIGREIYPLGIKAGRQFKNEKMDGLYRFNDIF